MSTKQLTDSRIPYAYTLKARAWGDDPELGEKIGHTYSKLRRKIFEKEKPPVEELMRCIKEHPGLPHFKALMAEHYYINGEAEKYNWIMEEVAATRPDYFFCRLFLATKAMNNGNHGLATDLLGPEPELHILFPERTVFHEMEALTFELVALRLLKMKNAQWEAEERIQRMGIISPSHAYISIARDILWTDETEDEDGEEDEDTDPQLLEILKQKEAELASIQMKEPPQFKTNIHCLYHEEHYWDITEIETLLHLDRSLLVQDLEEVLRDAMRRYEYYHADHKTPSWAPVHALFLLADLESEESLPLILEFLSFGHDFLEYWLSDMMTEDLWEVLFWTGRKQLDQLIALACDESYYLYARTMVSTMLGQWGLQNPENRTEIIEYMKVLLISNNPDRSFVTSDQATFNACVINDCVALQAHELLPLIESLYKQRKVETGFSGNYRTIVEDMKKGPGEGVKRPFMKGRIRGRYEELDRIWKRK